jgi:hypothetical protein
MDALVLSFLRRTKSTPAQVQTPSSFPLHEAVKGGDEDAVLVLIKTLGPTSVNARDNVWLRAAPHLIVPQIFSCFTTSPHPHIHKPLTWMFFFAIHCLIQYVSDEPHHTVATSTNTRVMR